MASSEGRNEETIKPTGLTGAPHPPRPRRVDAEKAFGQARQMFGRDALALILDR